ncbi:MAG: cadmium-translocating P-type ATPase [Muribaculaceae bacterium]|nr:cadmium-translocating P-type ATPase [Muribaculaceae bacterium]
MIHSHEHKHNDVHEEHCHSHGCSCCCGEGQNHCETEEEEMSWWKPALSLVLLLAGIAMSAMDISWFQNRWVQLAWYGVAWLPTGLGVLREAIEEAREGEVFSEFLLMTVASIGAFAIGEFPEAVAVMTLYCIGEALQDRAVSRARGNIKSLIAFRPDHAVVIRDGKHETVDPSRVMVGDIVEVKPGERVPIDGTLTGQAAAFDTAALTGESQPRVIEAGDEVLAGMIASESIVRLQAIRPASESAMTRILHLVEEATERKAPAELFIRRFARIYTPTVVGIAVLLVVVPWLILRVVPDVSFDLAQWLHRALIFLVISCPCALVISIPLSYFAGIGAASRRGILFKGSNYLDAIAQVDTVVFDKTGTLTTGQFTVSHVDGLDDSQVAVVAAIEQGSPHPIARAITGYHEPAQAAVTQLRNIAGYGLSAQVTGKTWLVGTTRLLEHEGVAYPTELNDRVGTMVAVAIDGKYAGYIMLNDMPKEDAARAVSDLNRQGIATVMLSGDKQALADQVARELGIGKAHGDLLPQGKVEHIERLMQEDGRQVAMVGDGINDAPVLAMSNVGIAMGALGSDMAIETADVVIQTDQPSRVADAVTLGRRTRRIVGQNIAFAIAVKVLVMVLGVLGVANMWQAVFADVGVALLCVLNSLRLMRHSFLNNRSIQ